MYRLRIFIAVVFVAALASGCGGGSSQSDSKEVTAMRLAINGVSVPVVWEENMSVKALQGLLPLTVNTHMYGGFEQVGELGHSLPRNDTRITTSPGDIVLYSGNQIVLFFGANTWAYTRLGRITGKTQAELETLLGKSDAVIAIE